MNLIILSTQRSGSTMLCNDISGTNVLGNPDEWFGPWITKLRNNSQVSSRELSEYLMQEASTDNGNIAIKIMSNHLGHINNLYKMVNGIEEHKDELYHHFYGMFGKAVYVWLTRKEKVSQAVSRLMAKKTGIYHQFLDEESARLSGAHAIANGTREEINDCNIDDIDKEIQKIDKEEKIILMFLKAYNVDYLSVCYEDIITCRDYVHKIAAMMDESDITLSPRTIKKIGGSLSATLASRYRAEKARCAGSALKHNS